MGTALDKKRHITNTMELPVLRALLDPILYQLLLRAALVRAALFTKPNATPLLALYQWSLLLIKTIPFRELLFFSHLVLQHPFIFASSAARLPAQSAGDATAGMGTRTP